MITNFHASTMLTYSGGGSPVVDKERMGLGRRNCGLETAGSPSQMTAMGLGKAQEKKGPAAS
jgi:hypothetical protein